ncbi:hypothetical protein [Kordiimonas sp.]|uniref:hypothetical protein n=1 Tax=Kordiimonas sp. TaxID=1970157 RepID=UPI003B520561
MIEKKLPVGQIVRLELDSIELAVLPELKSTICQYYRNDDYVYRALLPRKKNALYYLQSLLITAVQCEKDRSRFFLIRDFSVLDIIDNYPKKALNGLAVKCLVCAKPSREDLTGTVETYLIDAMQHYQLLKDQKSRVHYLLDALSAPTTITKNPAANEKLTPPKAIPIPQYRKSVIQQDRMPQLFDIGE